MDGKFSTKKKKKKKIKPLTQFEAIGSREEEDDDGRSWRVIGSQSSSVQLPSSQVINASSIVPVWRQLATTLSSFHSSSPPPLYTSYLRQILEQQTLPMMKQKGNPVTRHLLPISPFRSRNCQSSSRTLRISSAPFLPLSTRQY